MHIYIYVCVCVNEMSLDISATDSSFIRGNDNTNH